MSEQNGSTVESDQNVVNEAFGAPTEADQVAAQKNFQVDGIDVDRTKFSRDLIARTIGIEIRMKSFGINRRVESARVVEFEGETEVDTQTGEKIECKKAKRERTTAGKKLLDAEELRQINSLRVKLGNDLRDIAVESGMFGAGCYLIATVSIKRVKALVDEFDRNFWPLAEAFAEKYEGYVEAAKEDLGPLFDPEDYLAPNAVLSEFNFDYRFFSFDTPAALEQVAEEIFQEEIVRNQKKAELAWEEITQALRVNFVELIKNFNAKLEPGADGKKKAFRDSYLEKVLNFIANFREQNSIVRDATLEKLIDEAEKTVAGITAQQIAKDETVRTAVETAFSRLADEAQQMVDIRTRKITVKARLEKPADEAASQATA